MLRRNFFKTLSIFFLPFTSKKAFQEPLIKADGAITDSLYTACACDHSLCLIGFENGMPVFDNSWSNPEENGTF